MHKYIILHSLNLFVIHSYTYVRTYIHTHTDTHTHTSRKLVLMSYPAMTAVPSVGEMSPVSMLKVVVLPAPAGGSGWGGEEGVAQELFKHRG